MMAIVPIALAAMIAAIPGSPYTVAAKTAAIRASAGVPAYFGITIFFLLVVCAIRARGCSFSRV